MSSSCNLKLLLSPVKSYLPKQIFLIVKYRGAFLQACGTQPTAVSLCLFLCPSVCLSNMNWGVSRIHFDALLLSANDRSTGQSTEPWASCGCKGAELNKRENTARDFQFIFHHISINLKAGFSYSPIIGYPCYSSLSHPYEDCAAGLPIHGWPLECCMYTEIQT